MSNEIDPAPTKELRERRIRVQVLAETSAPLWSYSNNERRPTPPICPDGDGGEWSVVRKLGPTWLADDNGDGSWRAGPSAVVEREPWECMAVAVSEGMAIWYWRRWLVVRMREIR